MLMAGDFVRCSGQVLIKVNISHIPRWLYVSKSRYLSWSRLYVRGRNYEMGCSVGRAMGCYVSSRRPRIPCPLVISLAELCVSVVIEGLELASASSSMRSNHIRHSEFLPSVHILPITTADTIQNYRNNCLVLRYASTCSFAVCLVGYPSFVVLRQVSHRSRDRPFMYALH
jgi:hypothetical protein